MNDPLLRAQKDAFKDGLDRLRALSGTAFDATYLTAERLSRALLVQLATHAAWVARSRGANVLRTMAQQAREQTTRALVILPKARAAASGRDGGRGLSLGPPRADGRRSPGDPRRECGGNGRDGGGAVWVRLQ